MALKSTDITPNSAHVVEFHGYSIRETGATDDVSVTFRDGTVLGQILAVAEIAAGRSASWELSERIDADAGLGVYVEVTGTGTLEGVLYYKINDPHGA
jgi:hypothetical protein